MSDAVILTCHGTIADLGDLEAFLRNVRRGHPAPPELVAEIRRRYELIGPSPLLETSRRQAALLEARLGVPCRAAGRLWDPYPREILAELATLGATRVLSLPLAPQSVHVYHAAVEEAAAEGGSLTVVRSPAWGTEPALLEAFAETIDEALSQLADLPAAQVPVVLTAHSLPRRVIESGDPYEAQYRQMAALVATPLTARGHRVEIAFQSQGAGAGAWLGPDFTETLQALATQGFRAAVVAPIGFLAEHVETLFDLDVEGAAAARAAGIDRYVRACAVGTRPRLIDALVSVAERSLGRASSVSAPAESAGGSGAAG